MNSANLFILNYEQKFISKNYFWCQHFKNNNKKYDVELTIEKIAGQTLFPNIEIFQKVLWIFRGFD